MKYSRKIGFTLVILALISLIGPAVSNIEVDGNTVYNASQSTSMTLGDWNYKKNVEIQEKSGMAINRIPVVAQVDIGSASPSSIRVVNESSGSVISYAYKQVSGSTYNITFKTDLAADETNTDYAVYYGNSAASDASSNWKSVRYNAYDEFDDGSLSSGGYNINWNTKCPGGGCTIQETSGYASLKGGGGGDQRPFIYSSEDFVNFKAETRLQRETDGQIWVIGRWNTQNYGTYAKLDTGLKWGGGGMSMKEDQSGTGLLDYGNMGENTWYKLKYSAIGPDSCMDVSGNPEGLFSNSTDCVNFNGDSRKAVGFGGREFQGKSLYDYIRIERELSPEPEITVGAESSGNKPPQIDLLSTTDSSWNTGNTQDLEINVSDPNGDALKDAQYWVEKWTDASTANTTVVGKTNITLNTNGYATYTNAFEANDTNKNWTLYVSTFDSNGGYNTSITTQKITGSAPTITNAAPSSTNVNPNNVQLEVDVSDSDSSNLNISFYDASDDSLIEKIKNTGDGTKTVNWNSLSEDSSYSWYAEVTDGVNTAQTSTGSFTTIGVTLNWNDESSNEDGFRIYSNASGTLQQVADVSSDSETATVYNPGLETGKNTTYEVAAYNQYGESNRATGYIVP